MSAYTGSGIYLKLSHKGSIYGLILELMSPEISISLLPKGTIGLATNICL